MSYIQILLALFSSSQDFKFLLLNVLSIFLLFLFNVFYLNHLTQREQDVVLFRVQIIFLYKIIFHLKSLCLCVYYSLGINLFQIVAFNNTCAQCRFVLEYLISNHLHICSVMEALRKHSYQSLEQLKSFDSEFKSFLACLVAVFYQHLN